MGFLLLFRNELLWKLIGSHHFDYLGGDIIIDGEDGEEDFTMENSGTGNEDDDYFD